MKELELSGTFYGHKFYKVDVALFVVSPTAGVMYDDFFVMGLPLDQIKGMAEYSRSEGSFLAELEEYVVSPYHDSEYLPQCQELLELELVRLNAPAC